MRRLAVTAAILVGLALGTVQASAQGEKYQGPTCELDKGHYLVRSAITYISGATEEEAPDKRQQLLLDAQRNLIEAVRGDRQDDPAVWYFFGRYYVLTDDPVGADSAFRRVEEQVPDCAEDIGFYRETLWVQTVNAGIDSLRAGSYEGAREAFRKANAIQTEANVAYFYLASVFADEGETDSALYYFKRVTAIGTADTAHLDNYQTAVENVATLHHMLEEWDSAAVWYKRARELNPSNADALFGLAEAYAGMGEQDRVVMIYDSVLANPAGMKDVDLFNAGVKLFNADEFDRAVQAFEAGLEKNGFHRDALYNLANTYLAIVNDANQPQSQRDEALTKMAEVTHRLVAVDPRNRSSFRLLAAAHSLQNMDDTTVVILREVDALTFEVVVDISRPITGGYSVHGRVVNLEDTEMAFPTITFEFLDGAGKFVSSHDIPGETLTPKGSKRFSLTGASEAIVAWRYKIGS